MTALQLDLGVLEYGRALELQRGLAEKRARGEVPDMLLLMEHDHVITLGRKTSTENFRPQQVPVFEVERGGDATYHGPGQLIGYPIVLLEDHDVRRHVREIEDSLIAAVARWGIACGRIEGHRGVWVEGRKLASIGVAVTSWVAYHGFALNVNSDLSYFELIRPCGLDPGTMTSMQTMLGRRIDLDEVKKAVANEYSRTTGREFVPADPASLVSADMRK